MSQRFFLCVLKGPHTKIVYCLLYMAVKHSIFLEEIFEIKIVEITRYNLIPHIIAVRIIYEVHAIIFR